MALLVSILSFAFLGLIGLAFLTALPAQSQSEADRRRTRERGVPVTATVIEAGTDDETAFVVLEYEYGGVRRVVREIWMTGSVGNQVPVLVDPQNPNHVVPVHSPARWYIAPALLVCGLMCVVISVWAVVHNGSRLGRATPAATPFTVTTYQYVGDDGEMSIHFTPPTDAQREATRRYWDELLPQFTRKQDPNFVGPPWPARNP